MELLFRTKPVFYWLFLLFVNVVNSQSKPIDKENVRLITLSPHLAELVVSAGALDHLVGVVSYSDFPSEVKKIQQVGDAFKLDYESIVALQADYILSWKGGTPAAIVDKLQSLNIKVIETEISQLSDIAKTITQIAELTHTQEQAKISTQKFTDKLAELKSQNHPKTTSFIETYHQPLYTVSGKHWISEAVSVCGYENIFKNLNQLSVTVTIESVILKNPQAIINISKQEDKQWQKWNDLAAVKNKNIMTIDPDIISRPSMRILQGIAQLCQH